MTYESLRKLWWEAHIISRFRFIVEVSTALQERENRIKQTMDAITCLLGYRHKHFIEASLKRGVDLSGHLYTKIILSLS